MSQKHNEKLYIVQKSRQNSQIMRRQSKLKSDLMSTKDSNFFKTQADEDYGNAIIGYGSANRVPQGKWILIFTTQEDMKDHEIDVRFTNQGKLFISREDEDGFEKRIKGLVVGKRKFKLEIDKEVFEMTINSDFTEMTTDGETSNAYSKISKVFFQ